MGIVSRAGTLIRQINENRKRSIIISYQCCRGSLLNKDQIAEAIYIW